jgi:hypothetical protein
MTHRIFMQVLALTAIAELGIFAPAYGATPDGPSTFGNPVD